MELFLGISLLIFYLLIAVKMIEDLDGWLKHLRETMDEVQEL